MLLGVRITYVVEKEHGKVFRLASNINPRNREGYVAACILIKAEEG
jgi:hypothetical protein